LHSENIRETTRSLIEIGLDVGYKNPSHFAQLFRRVVGRFEARYNSDHHATRVSAVSASAPRRF
jgi:AraC-like DNA-binding protein